MPLLILRIQDKFNSFHNIAQEITVLWLTRKSPEYVGETYIVLQLRLNSMKCVSGIAKK